MAALLTVALAIVGTALPATGALAASTDPTTVHTYRATPGDVASDRYQLKANDADVFVAKYVNRSNNRMHVARFSSDDATATLTVSNSAPITSWKVYPERYYPSSAVTVSGNTITFNMSSSLRYAIVQLNGTDPQLAIINDPKEDPATVPDPAAANVVNVADYATDRTGASDQTTQVTAAIDALYADPNKNVLYFPDGAYKYAGLELRNRTKPVTVYVDEGALLKNRIQPTMEAMEPAIGIWDSSNITISGRGVFDANGFANYDTSNGGWRHDANTSQHQGGVMVTRSLNIVFNDTLARDAKQWNWETHTAKNITFNNIKGLTPFAQPWIDGLDLASGQNITVNGAFTLGNDDTFASGHYNPSDLFTADPDRLTWDTEDSYNYSINNTLGWSAGAGNGIRLGHAAYGHQMRDYTFNNVNYLGFSGGDNGITVQNSPDSGVRNYPKYQNVTVNNSSFDTSKVNYNFRILGKDSSDATDRIGTVALNNVWFSNEHPAEIANVTDLTIKDLTVAGAKVTRATQTALTLTNVINKTLDYRQDSAPVIAPIATRTANVGETLVLPVTATDADGDAITLSIGSAGLPTGASFDAASGKLTWTPTTAQIGSYTIEFVAKDSGGASASATATVQVVNPFVEQVPVVVANDTNVQTWNTESSLNLGDNEHLRTLNFNDSAKGPLGEKYAGGVASQDAKLTYLHFDLSSAASKLSSQKLQKAELKMTYFGPTKGALTGTNTLLVAPVTPGWIEGNGKTTPTARTNTVSGAMTWLTKAAVNTSTVATSAAFDVTSTAKVGNDSTYSATQKPNGSVATTDVTSFVTAAAASGSMDLAVNEAKKQDLIFVSREGAARNTNAANMAPTLVLTFAVDDSTAPAVTATTAPAAPDGSAGWYRTAPTTTLTATDSGTGVKSIEYSTDGGTTWAAYSTPLVAGAGSTTLSYRATDKVGNVSTVGTRTIGVDGAAPTVTAAFDDQNGQAAGPVDVTLTAKDGDSGVDAVSFQVDGGTWTTYTGPISVSGAGSHTVAYRAADKAGNLSAVATATVRLIGPDVTAPVVQVTTDPAAPTGSNGWFTDPVTVTLTATDDRSTVKSIEYSWDGQNWAAYSAPLSLGQGNSTVNYRATDASGNTSVVKSIAAQVDTVAPTVTADYDDKNGTTADPVPVTLTAADATSGVAAISYQLDGGASTNYTAPFPVTGAGSHTVVYTATDQAGNTSAAGTATIVIAAPDTAPPVVTAKTDPASPSGKNGWFTGAVSAQLTAVDDRSGVASIEYSYNGAAWTAYTAPVTVTEGVATIDYRATDGVGNTSATATMVVNRDTTKPISTASFDDQDGQASGPVTVTLNATDTGSGIDSLVYAVNGGAEQPYTAPFQVGGNGAVITYRATDKAGNAEATRTATVRITPADTTAPVVTGVITPATPTGISNWYSSPASVVVTATDNQSGVASIEYQIGNGAWAAYTAPIEMPQGTTVVNYRATDGKGNVSATGSTTVKRDDEGPTVNLATAATSTKTTVTLTAADSTSGVASIEYRIDANAWTPYTAPFAITTAGTHTVGYAAVDKAGNRTARSSAVLVGTDKSGPIIVVGQTPTAPNGSNGWYTGDAPKVSAQATDVSGVASLKYKGSSAAYADYTGPVTAPAGGSIIYFQATDTKGNISTGSTTVRFDNTIPTTAASFNDLNGTSAGPIAVTLKATDTLSGWASTSYQIDGGAWTAYTAPISVSGAGSHVVAFASTDKAGNTEAAKTVTVRVAAADTTAPVVTPSTKPAAPTGSNNWFTGSVSLTLTATDPTVDGAATSSVKSTEYQIGTGAWTAYTTALVVPVGTTSYSYRSTDKAGNVSAPQTVSLQRDTTAPTVTASYPSTIKTGPLPVTLSATDAVSGVDTITYSLDGAAFQSYTGAVSITGKGSHTLIYRSTDKAGLSSAAKTLTVTLNG